MPGRPTSRWRSSPLISALLVDVNGTLPTLTSLDVSSPHSSRTPQPTSEQTSNLRSSHVRLAASWVTEDVHADKELEGRKEVPRRRVRLGTSKQRVQDSSAVAPFKGSTHSHTSTSTARGDGALLPMAQAAHDAFSTSTLATSYYLPAQQTPEQAPSHRGGMQWRTGHEPWRQHDHTSGWKPLRSSFSIDSLGSTGKGILIGMLSAFGSAALAVGLGAGLALGGVDAGLGDDVQGSVELAVAEGVEPVAGGVA